MIEIALTITIRSPLNISSGAQQGTLAQRGLLKDKDGWPIIPASALKGRWRHAVEQVARGLALKPAACATHDKMCRQQEVCVVCQLFGSPWQPGPLRFVDLEIVGPAAVKDLRKDPHYRPKTTERTGVALNRRRRGAQDRFLYTTELFWPGVPLIFGGRLHGDLTPAQAGLLLAGLRLLPALGGGNSSGLGWIAAAATITAADGSEWTAAQLQKAIKENGTLMNADER